MEDEIKKPLKLLTNNGYTNIFIAHEGERDFLNEKGEKYTKIYPRGEKRAINFLADTCDIIGYAQLQPNNDKNEEVYSTLYLKGTPAYHAGSRWTHIVPQIPEWNMDKLGKAIDDAIAKIEDNTGEKAITLDEDLKNKAAARVAAESEKRPLTDLKQDISIIVSNIVKTEGNKLSYEKVVMDVLGTSEFKVKSATEDQRDQVELVYAALIERGYTPTALDVSQPEVVVEKTEEN